MVRNFLFLFFIIGMIFGTSAALADPFLLQVDLKHPGSYENELQEMADETIFLSAVRFYSDSAVQASELRQLTGLHDNQTISSDHIVNAIEDLRRKGKFSTVRFELRQLPHSKKYVLQVSLKSEWTFKKIKFKGMLQGKDAYKHFYVLEPGEAFDSNKHRSSLVKIEEALKSQGYLYAKAYDYLVYDKKNKTVSVRVTLEFGQQFLINSVEIEASADEYREPLEKIARGDCLFKQYSKGRAADCAKKLQDYLAKQGLYNVKIHLQENINFQKPSVALKFLVTIKEKKRFVFDGNAFFSQEQLYDIIFAFGKSGGLLPKELLKQEIMTAYQQHGFWDVGIITEEYDSCYYFFIVEGERSQLNKVEFIGNKEVGADQLQTFFSKISKGKWLNERVLNEAIQECIAFYKQQGFLHARLVKKDFIQKAPTSFNVGLVIDEGNRFYLSSVTIENFETLEKESLFQECRKKPFDPSIVKKQKQWLLAHFQQQGYLYVKATPDIQFNENQVTICWQLEGVDQPVQFGKPIVVGVTSLPIHKILRELDFDEGDVWSKQKLDESLQRLRKLGIFETIYLYPHDIAKPEVKKPIIIKLKEDDPFEVRLRVGFQQVSRTFGAFHQGSTYKVGGSVIYKNPFNEADFIRSDVDVTRFYRNFAVQYRRPWIFNLPIAFQAKAYSNKYIQPVFIGSNKPLYRATQQGGLIALNKTTRSYDFGINTGIETMETDDLSVDLARAINFEPLLIDQKIPYYFIEPTMLLNYLDDALNPTRGSLTIFSCKAMIPWKSSTVSFFKLLFEHSFFIPIKRTVLGLRVRAGHIFNQDFETIMPPERFYLGGPNSLRSYQPNLAPPLGSFIDSKGKRQLVPQGGKTMGTLNIEYRFPLIWNIGMALFQDLGILAQRSLTEVVNGGRLLAGTGFGLRYHTPVGPLRFDVGFRWKRFDPDEDGYVWYLTLGQAF